MAAEFQSTRPIRGATPGKDQLLTGHRNFNPRAPYGARRSCSSEQAAKDSLFQSTRPIRGATREADALLEFVEFQSTRPIRGATLWHDLEAERHEISIHAPHTGRDQ